MTKAVDFDGVIHRYSKGWYDGTIYDPPMDGAIEGLRWLMEQDSVFIFTSRNTMQVADWLSQFDFKVTTDDMMFRHEPEWDGSFWNERGALLVTNRKLAATEYIDDRAVRFVSWSYLLSGVEPLKAEDVLGLIQQKIDQERTPYHILDTLIIWLHQVANFGGVIRDGASISAELGAGSATGTEAKSTTEGSVHRNTE